MIKRLKFALFSLIGISLFFIPFCEGVVPVIYITNLLKKIFNDYMLYISVGVILVALITAFTDKNLIKKVLSIISLATIVIVYRLSCFSDPLRYEFISLIYTVIITTLVSGYMVVFLLRSGLIEFIAVLFEPIMKIVFKIPGNGAIDCLTSFVSSPSVGLYFTNVCYIEGKYTEKEACTIALNFSVVSLGFMGTLASMAGIENMYNMIILVSFGITLVLAIVLVRIPPLSKKRDVYIDEKPKVYQGDKTTEAGIYKKIVKAISAGEEAVLGFNKSNMFQHMKNTAGFVGNMVVLMVMPLAVMLYITNYTSIMKWLGKAFEMILLFFHIPNATEIAPAVLLGFIEIALPTMYIAEQEISTAASFFVVVLSIVQLVFMAETGLVVLSSKLPIKFKDLLAIFLERTLIAIFMLSYIIKFLF